MLFVRNIGESAKEESGGSFIFQLVEDIQIMKKIGPEFPAV